MRLEGSSSQVQMGKEPEQRIQHYHMKINPTTTAEKEDNKDSTATHQQAIIAVEKEDATDSTANKATTTYQVITSTATEEDDTDSTAKPSAHIRRGHRTFKEEASRTSTTTTASWSTTSTRDHFSSKTNKYPVQWEVPNQIRFIKEEPGLGDGFVFMGEDNEPC